MSGSEPVTRDEAIERARVARVGRLATVRPDGAPHVVPVVFAVVGEGRRVRVYWTVDAKPKRRAEIARLHNIATNPAVELVVDGYEEDWTRLWWVRLTGRGRVVVDDDERSHALAALSHEYPQYRRQPPPGPVVAIDVERVSWWEPLPT